MVSDTHISVRARHLPAPLLAALRGVDLILHAGDLVALSVLDELATVAPVEAVHGNVDGWEVINALPRTRIVQAGGKRIGLVHGDGAGSSTLLRAKRAFAGEWVDAIVFGHSHQPYCQREGDMLLFNPGSPTDKRREPRPSCGLLQVGETIEGEIVHL
ncbi:MAG: metallophosphoesterase family protein [Chloroflexota bacterium]